MLVSRKRIVNSLIKVICDEFFIILSNKQRSKLVKKKKQLNELAIYNRILTHFRWY